MEGIICDEKCDASERTDGAEGSEGRIEREEEQ
jgi:hypothetical protein